MGSQRVRHNWATFTHCQPTSENPEPSTVLGMLDKFAKRTERSRNSQAGENVRSSGCSLESTPDIHENLISNNSQFSRGPFKDRIQ